MNISKYKTLVFDCDGVVLDSNRVKTDAFFKVALPFGRQYAEALKAHHVEYGGVSRYAKLAHFIENILPTGTAGANLEALLQAYAAEVQSGLLACGIAEGLLALREQTIGTNWLIVSGGDQAELNDIFEQRGILDLFNGGIFGSPDNKLDILARELGAQNITEPALFIGDSKYDFEAAHAHGLDFVFVHNWTEVKDWEEFVSENDLKSLPSIADLLP
ncbi:MAG: HAD hydrolase-like protein [Rhodobacteraceae bacterium]|nr:HAD hydrolase-like protein [Paracoccaceae bacterium]